MKRVKKRTEDDLVIITRDVVCLKTNKHGFISEDKTLKNDSDSLCYFQLHLTKDKQLLQLRSLWAYGRVLWIIEVRRRFRGSKWDVFIIHYQPWENVTEVMEGTGTWARRVESDFRTPISISLQSTKHIFYSLVLMRNHKQNKESEAGGCLPRGDGEGGRVQQLDFKSK